jgi:hypothetical protein
MAIKNAPLCLNRSAFFDRFAIKVFILTRKFGAALESRFLMGSITKRFVIGVTTTA